MTFTLTQQVILTGFEYACIMLLMFKILGARVDHYVKPLLVFAFLYIVVVALLFNPFRYGFIGMIIAASILIVFIKFILNKRLDVDTLVGIFTSILILLTLHAISVIILGSFLSRPVEYIFSDAVISFIITIIFCLLFYLYFPLYLFYQALKSKKPTFLLIPAILATFMATYSLLNFANLLEYTRDAIMFIGLSFIIVAAAHLIIKFLRRLMAKRSALKQLEYIDNLPESQVNTHSALQVIRLLALVAHKDNSRVTRFVETRLNNYEHKIDSAGSRDIKTSLQGYDNQVLAAYLYAKTLDLQNSGVKCELNLNSSRYVVSKIRISDLLTALDIVIDEVLSAIEKEKSAVTISLDQDFEGTGRTSIRVSNFSDRVTENDIVRMFSEDYSLKTGTIRGIRKLAVINAENDMSLKIQLKNLFDTKSILDGQIVLDDKKYLQLVLEP